MKVKSGTYSGTGSAQSISGLGFTPKVVVVKGGANIAAIRTDTMATDSAKPMTGLTATSTGVITSLDLDGFTLGTAASVNANGTTYYWLALGAGGGTDIETGSYAGNGSDNRNISLSVLSAVKPNVLIILAATADGAVRMKTTDEPTDDSSFRLNAAQATNAIQLLTTGSFQVGTNADVNTGTGTPTYHWVALLNATSILQVITYTGDSSDNRSITGAGFHPDNVWTKRGDSTTVGALRFKNETGDNAFLFTAVGEASDIIQALETDGFQVGTNASANLTTAPYFAVCFKDGSSSGASGLAAFGLTQSMRRLDMPMMNGGLS